MRWSATGRAIVLFTLLFSIDCASALSSRRHPSDHKYLTADEREAAIRRAQIWQATDVSHMDIRRGPEGPGSFAPGAVVSCDYFDEPLGGTSPKFACTIAPDDRVRVRYGRDNAEVYAGVAATRLLWALGFGADALYPVQVICRHCPPQLTGASHPRASETVFDVAAIERKMAGHELESRPDSGWSWRELELVTPADQGAPRAQRDALKLLAVILQHTDSKPAQQRLLCLDDGAKSDRAHCAHTFMMIHDVGQTFGRGNVYNRSAVGSANLDTWANTPVWKDRSTCTGNLRESETGTLDDPQISEAGRRFLSDLLRQLSDSQIRDLFDVARFPQKAFPNGPTTLDGWVNAFKQKRAEVDSVTCRT